MAIFFVNMLNIPALAGAGLDQRLRAVQQQRAYQQQRQQAIAQQQRAQQLAVAQRQVSQRQAQVVAQRQAQVIAQQQALQMRSVAERQAALQGQAQQQAIQQQQLAYQQALVSQQRQTQQQLNSFSSPQVSSQFPNGNVPNYNNSAQFMPSGGLMFEPHVEEVVDMATIWKDFEITSEAWPLIVDLDSKEVIVAKFIEDFRADGIVLRKTPRHYVQMIDSMSFENPEMLKNSFDRVLQTVAIIEYDFGNGIDPDTLARRVLGEQGYKANRQRLNR